MPSNAILSSLPTPRCREIGRWIMDPEQSVGDMEFEKQLLNNLLILECRMGIAD